MLKRLLPPTLYKIITFRFSFPKLLRDLLIPPCINKSNTLKRFRTTGLYGVFDSFSQVKNTLWDNAQVVESRINQLEALSHEKIVVSDLYKDNALLFTTINTLLRNGDCRVLDFGGASGHYYYHARQHATGNGTLSWNVVDLPDTIAVGKEYAERNNFTNISFHGDLADVPDGPVDIVYTNAVLQYIDNAYDFIGDLLDRQPEYAFYSRFPLHEKTSYITSQAIEGRETPYRVFNTDEFFEFHRDHGYDLLLCTSCSNYKNMNCDVPKQFAIPCDRIVIFQKSNTK